MSKILFLRDMSIKDYHDSAIYLAKQTEDIDDNDNLSDNNIEIESEILSLPGIKYDNLPKYYIDKDTWIETTNLCCLYCGITIGENPWPYITSAEENANLQTVYEVNGLFCSPPCIKNYINPQHEQALRLTIKVVSKLIGITCEDIPRGENKQQLIRYSGIGLTDKEFKENNMKTWIAFLNNTNGGGY